MKKIILNLSLLIIGTLFFTFNSYSQGAGTALDFDGASDYVKIPSLTWTPTSFTVEWWVFPLTTKEWNQTIGGERWGEFIFHTDPTGGVYVGTDIATRFTPVEILAGTVKINEWNHFSFTFSLGNANFYKNGILLASKSGMSNPLPWVNGFFIGESHIMSKIDGQIDEVRIWNRALTQTEIQESMCKKLTGTEAGLVAYYPMNEGIDNTCSGGEDVCDMSGNGNNGVKF